jgi:hypothetical protein
MINQLRWNFGGSTSLKNLREIITPQKTKPGWSIHQSSMQIDICS